MDNVFLKQNACAYKNIHKMYFQILLLPLDIFVEDSNAYFTCLFSNG